MGGRGRGREREGEGERERCRYIHSTWVTMTLVARKLVAMTHLPSQLKESDKVSTLKSFRDLKCKLYRTSSDGVV